MENIVLHNNKNSINYNEIEWIKKLKIQASKNSESEQKKKFNMQILWMRKRAKKFT